MEFKKAYDIGLKLSSFDMLERLEEALAKQGCDGDAIPGLAEEVRSALTPHEPIPAPAVLAKKKKPWYRAEDYPDGDNWARYLDLLKRKGWHPDTINSINRTSTEILNLMPKPDSETFECYGL